MTREEYTKLCLIFGREIDYEKYKDYTFEAAKNTLETTNITININIPSYSEMVKYANVVGNNNKSIWNIKDTKPVTITKNMMV